MPEQTGKPALGRVLLAIGVVAFAAALHWAGRHGWGEDRAAQAGGKSATFGDPQATTWAGARADTRGGGVAAAAPAAAPARIADTEEATVAQYVTEKYRFLLDRVGYLKGAQVAELQRVLLERELLAGNAGAQQHAALAQAESRIVALLQPADRATYETLKDSDREQFELNEYAGGISNVAPLSSADRESILRTKLAYRDKFRQLLADSGLQRGDLAPAEREYAYSVASRALHEYRNGYLQEVRQYLSDDEQFALLSNFEKTEFEAELARLQTLAGLPGRGGS